MATLDTESTSGRLIAASKVTGTMVYDATGTKLGSVHDVMLDKISGRPDYAVISFGGIFGLGARCHPLPWSELSFDTRLGGYVINVDLTQLEGAPSYEADELSIWDDNRSNDVDTYYLNRSHFGIDSIGQEGLRSRNAI
jgi:hypothetical protein